jgi:hypothetical protein
LADPKVRLQIKGEKFSARARTATPAERAALWPKMVAVYGPYAEYQTKTDQIPIVGRAEKTPHTISEDRGGRAGGTSASAAAVKRPKQVTAVS